jgi:hypothetical protein
MQSLDSTLAMIILGVDMHMAGQFALNEERVRSQK